MPGTMTRAGNAPRTLLLLVMLAVAALSQAFAADPPALAGRVWDARTDAPLAGASIQLPDLGHKTISDRDGRFAFDSLPAGRHLVGIHHEGFEPHHVIVLVPAAEPLEVRLEPASAFTEEITVAATPFGADRLDVAPSVDVIDKSTIATRSGLSIGDAVGSVAGARNISTGDQAGKPMVRGLTNERIRVLTDGFAHNYQQFSLRHPPNVEPLDAERIEVVRGPAAVLYGPEAMGGVVNLVSPDLLSATSGASILHGDVAASYADNNDAWTGHAALDGAFGSVGYRASMTERGADDTETPRGTLTNTDYDQQSMQLALGTTLGRGARLSARWSDWENEFGFFLPASPAFRLRLENQIAVVQGSLPLSFGQVDVSLHQGENLRQAYPGGFAGPTAVNLDLDTTTARVELRHDKGERLKGWAVIERGSTENATSGLVALLPNYEATTWSAALYEEFRIAGDDVRGWTLSGGARYDTKDLDVLATPGREILEGFTGEWSAFSGSLGVVRRFARRGSVALSLGRGWRAPSEYELFAQGQHTGVAAFERGNPELQEESNVNAEVSVEWKGERWNLVGALFRSEFDDHVYAAQTDEFVGSLPVVEYRQTDATIDGYELQVGFLATPTLSFSASADHVSTENDATGRPLPVTPPDRLTIGARYAPEFGGAWHGAYLEATAATTEDGEPSGEDELFSRGSFDGYTLVDLALGIHRQAGAVDLAFDLVVRNLTDREYMDFLDTYKQFFDLGARSPGRNVRLTMRVTF